MNSKSRYTTALIILATFTVIFAAYKWNGEDMVKTGEAVDLGDLPEEVAQNVERKSDSINVFKSPELGFEFEYPSDYAITKLQDGDGETVLLQKEGKGAQIYISDFTADVEFNADLVKGELAGEKMENLKDVNLKNKIPAVSFASLDPSLGETSELWFVREGKLYQVTAQRGHEKLMEMIGNTWKF